jgi:hypothetical protein
VLSLLRRVPPQAVRRIDRVRLKGSVVPMSLYTYDCGEAAGYVDRAQNALAPAPSADADAEAEAEAGAGPDGGGCTGMSFADYRTLFATGVDAYVAGDWPAATETLRRCADAWPADVPAAVLLGVMAAEGGVAPADWEGVRELSEK